VQNGLWVAPIGITAIFASQLAARLARRIGTTAVAPIGIAVDVVGLAGMAFLLRPGVTFLQLLPALVLYGLGAGFTNSQLTNVILAGVDPNRVGTASGVNTTGRQVGGALGVAVVGAVFTAVSRSDGIAAAVKPSILVTAAVMLLAAIGAWRIPHLPDDRETATKTGLEPVLEPVEVVELT